LIEESWARVCWHYDACVVLDGNPLIEENLTYIQSDESTKEINRENRAYRSKTEPRGDKRSYVTYICQRKGAFTTIGSLSE